jgi:hypothetical protein
VFFERCVVVAAIAAARCRPGFEKGVSLQDIVHELFMNRYRKSHFFLSAQERLKMAQQHEHEGKSLSVLFSLARFTILLAQ